MLPFQVGAIDPNRPGAANGTWRKRTVRLNRPYLGFAFCLSSILLLLILLALEPALAAKPKGKKGKFLSATPSASAGEQSLANIPLPIGHEAKGLVLPDFDLEGHLRGRFEAASAKRLDEVHIGFQSLKIITYTPENKPDLTVELSEAILNMKTRILSSKERTIIKRADFDIAGDSVEFDTNTHTGKLVGNVKMVITSQSQLLGNQNE
jgi:lipopolysaccharide assembly outer membrane protein LptD (OstA)